MMTPLNKYDVIDEDISVIHYSKVTGSVDKIDKYRIPKESPTRQN
jgi:hypothetical protein